MRYPPLKTLTAIFLIALLAACSPANRALKHSKSLAKSGLTYEATLAALDAVEAKPNYKKAMVQVKTLGTKEIQNQMREFNELKTVGETVGALDAYVRAWDIEQRAANLGVLLTGTSAHASDFANLRIGYIQELDGKGQAALQSEDFTAAERIYVRALNYDPENESLRASWVTAVGEPAYREAQSLMTESKYRTAYIVLEDLERLTETTYKDARDIQSKAVKEGSVTIGVRDVLAPTRQELDIARGLRSDLISNLIGTQDPFIAWIDWNEKNRYEATEQPDYLLELEMTNWREMPGARTSYERKGYRRVAIVTKDPDTGAKATTYDYQKVIYHDIDFKYLVHGALRMALVDPMTKELLVSREVEDIVERTIATAQYSGDATNIYPGHWTNRSEDKPSDVVNHSGKAVLTSRFRTSNNPRIIYQMQEQIRNSLVKKASITMFEAMHNSTFLP
ncbi:MAG: hypothetical protein OSA46_01460 [Schleiferiaceae bacterium]|nr:hypothetical protein [Schleiferiaceae bacterium]